MEDNIFDQVRKQGTKLFIFLAHHFELFILRKELLINLFYDRARKHYSFSLLFLRNINKNTILVGYATN